MIEISPRAQTYFKNLIQQQESDGMGLRIMVLQPGTPAANCDLQFCPSGGAQEGDTRVPFDGFDLFIEADSQAWLEEAEIDFESDAAGGQLTIKAPNIKGSMPDEGATLVERVTWLLDAEINPRLAAHGGRVSLVEVTEACEVVLQFGGGCHGCGMVDMTLKEGIEKSLKEQIPEVTGVLDATDHSTGENPYYAS